MTGKGKDWQKPPIGGSSLLYRKTKIYNPSRG